MKKLNKEKILNIAWSLIFVVALAWLLVVSLNFSGVICLDKLVENKEYYINFLWPKMYGYLGAFLGISFFLAGFYYAECVMDVEMKFDKREEHLVKGLSSLIVIISSVVYISVGVLYFKSFSGLMVFLGVVVVFSIFSILSNYKEYKKYEKEQVEEAKKQDAEADDKDKLWDSVNLRINLFLALVVCCAALFFASFSKNVQEARNEYNVLSKYRVNYCFGHIPGFEENRATAKVEFVNMYGSSGRVYSLEQLEQEYINYRTGNGSWSNLWQFCQDSIAIELDSQVMYETFSSYPYLEEYGAIRKYYTDEEENSSEYYAETLDKLGDLEYFCACIEEELNAKGLTLRELNDSSEFVDEDYPYESATPEQVVEACQSFALKVEPVDGSVAQTEVIDSIDLSIDVGIGEVLSEVSITEKNGMMISKVTWLDLDLASQGKYAVIGEQREKIISGEGYKVLVYVDLPLTAQIAEDIELTIEGVDTEQLYIDWEYDKNNQLLIEFTFYANPENQVEYKAMEVKFDWFLPDEALSDCNISQLEVAYNIEDVSWQTFDAETGMVEDYSGDTFSGDNKCYIANIKLVPYEDISFDKVNCIFFGANINVYEYNQSTVKEPEVGVYPTAFFKKLSEDGQDYILVYLPYYQAYTTGVDGDVVNKYGENNYVYLVEDGILRIKDKPKLDYEFVSYKVTDVDGNKVWVPEGSLSDNEVPMPAKPIVVTGYFEKR